MYPILRKSILATQSTIHIQLTRHTHCLQSLVHLAGSKRTFFDAARPIDSLPISEKLLRESTYFTLRQLSKTSLPHIILDKLEQTKNPVLSHVFSKVIPIFIRTLGDANNMQADAPETPIMAGFLPEHARTAEDLMTNFSAARSFIKDGRVTYIAVKPSAFALKKTLYNETALFFDHIKLLSGLIKTDKQHFFEQIKALCELAKKNGSILVLDAEESATKQTYDELADYLNAHHCHVMFTVQAILKDSKKTLLRYCNSSNPNVHIKLVKGAYSPELSSFSDVHQSLLENIDICDQNNITTIVGSHNKSIQDYVEQKGSHIKIMQLLGIGYFNDMQDFNSQGLYVTAIQEPSLQTLEFKALQQTTEYIRRRLDGVADRFPEIGTFFS